MGSCWNISWIFPAPKKKGKGNPTCGAVRTEDSQRSLERSTQGYGTAYRATYTLYECLGHILTNHRPLLANGFSPWNNLNNKKIDHNTNLPRSFFFFPTQRWKNAEWFSFRNMWTLWRVSQINSLKRKVIWSSSQPEEQKGKKQIIRACSFPSQQITPWKTNISPKKGLFQ